MKTNGAQKAQDAEVFSRSRNQCIWMKTGMVDFRICENGFDCTSCPFDKEISRHSGQKPASAIIWKEAMRNPDLHKECRHMLTGRVPFKLCSHNYECKDCAYDQFLYEYDQLLGAESLPAQVARIDQAAALQVYCH